ncbi:MAG: CHAT domain-containing protein [candidate division Zixibacteria bacterium]|nr:CHAT domain-containing protein [candidate division Zixibacteria bacterium]
MKSAILVFGFVVLSVLCCQQVNAQNWEESLKTADSLAELHNYDSAIVVGNLALMHAEKEFGKEDTVVANVLCRLALYYESLRKFAEAEQLIIRSTKIRENILGSDHIDVARRLNSRAILLSRQAKYAEAEPLFARALAIREKVFSPDHAEVVRSINNLAIIYKKLGMYAEAELLYNQVLTIAKQTQHPQMAMFLRNLGSLFWTQCRYQEAEPYLIHALTTNENNFGLEHWAVASNLGLLAKFYREQGRYDKAEPLLLRALAINKKIFGPEYPAVSEIQNELANLYVELGKNAEAEALYNKALAIRERAHQNHDLVAETLERMSRLCRIEKNQSEALELAKRACRIRLKNLYDNIALSSEKDALAFSQSSRNSVNNYLTCFIDLQPANGAFTKETANIVYSNKGLISDGIFERQKSIVRETDSATLALAESFKSTKSQLSKLFVKGPGADIQVYRKEVDSLESFAIQLEANLSRRSASFRQYKDNRDISVNRLASLLSYKDILVEYLKYDYYQVKPDSSIPRYLAVLLTNEAKPIIVNLGDATEIEQSIDMYRKHMAYISTAGSVATLADLEDYGRISRKLHQLIWQPIEGFIVDKELALIAPDAALNTISFAGLVGSDESYLIESCAIHYLSAGRDIIRLNALSESGVGLFALGNPDYDASASDRSIGLPESASAITKIDYAVNRNIRSGCGELSEIDLSPLPGSNLEIQNIAAIWEGTMDELAVICLGRNATEDRFKVNAPGKRVIHLATHGYFLGGDCELDMAENRYESKIRWTGENPLLHSGLFFAGANHHGEGADSAGVEDGILTAYEVSALDLLGTELVVLSACETGLGRIQSGEGVYGLRRAFQIAGAETVISTLWSVSDQMAAEMSSKLYDRKGVSLPDTIRRIQLEKIDELRRQNKVDHPISWGALVAYGNWR